MVANEGAVALPDSQDVAQLIAELKMKTPNKTSAPTTGGCPSSC